MATPKPVTAPEAVPVVPITASTPAPAQPWWVPPWNVFLACGLCRAGVFKQFELGGCNVKCAKSSRAEKDDGVLDALPPEPHHRLLIFSHDAEEPAVWRVEEL